MLHPYSVLMSVYAKEDPRYFSEAIQSMLDQTVKPDEIVIVCDGPLSPSLDGVIEGYCKLYPSLFSLVRLNENNGLGIALSHGVSVCKNEIVARMDSDDVSASDRLEKQLVFLDDHPEVSVVGSQIAEFVGDLDCVVGYRAVPLGGEDIASYSKKRNPMNHMSVTFRKSDIKRVGGYRDCKGYEDWDLWVRMLVSGLRMANLPDVGVRVRVDAGMYDRRSGYSYFAQAMKFQKNMLKLGYVNRFEYAKSCSIRFVAAMVPNFVRRFIYQMLLRKRAV